MRLYRLEKGFILDCSTAIKDDYDPMTDKYC